MDLEGTFGVSKAGKQTFTWNGFEYYQHRINAHGNKVWRCCSSRRMKCKANLVCDGMKIIKINNANHNHDGNVSRALSRKAVGQMKMTMRETLAGCRATRGMVCSTLPDHVLVALPKKSSLNRALRRSQQKVLASDDVENALPPYPKDILFASLIDSQPSYCTTRGPNRID